MRMRVAGLILLAVTASAVSKTTYAASELVERVQAHLYAGENAAAADAAEEQLAQSPGDGEARFLLGAVQFLQAIEGLGREFYRYGLTGAGNRRSGIGMLPFFRIPVPPNPDPEKIDYDKLRAILIALVDDLGRAEETLSGVADAAIDIPIEIGNVRLDFTGDGVGTAGEALGVVLRPVIRFPRRDGETDTLLLIDFDSGDAPWLQAYCHLLTAIAEFLLAHDWHEAFEASFHGLFPAADLPMSRASPSTERAAASFGSTADLIAFIHLMHWPVAEPERMASVLQHLEAIPPLSRESWRRILAETDDRNEWLPNPAQSGALGIPIPQERIDGWLLFLDELEALLQGRKLLGHWRFEQGINLRRLFLEPGTFDLLLLIQGSAAIPYLEDGEAANRDTWRRLTQLFRGDFFRYAIWFN